MMPTDVLSQIIAHKKSRLADQRVSFGGLKKNMDSIVATPYHLFRKTISVPGRVNLIAEIKKASPSRGLIRDDFDAAGLAKMYAANGAAALSVLTEEKYFLGRPQYIRQVLEQVRIPVLAKDFVIDEIQIYELAHYGASAILLIVSILEDPQIKELLGVAGRLGLDCLVEVHNETELERALTAGAEMIGVNNRDLATLQVDTAICERIIPLIPRGKIIVAESGLSSAEDIQRMKAAGANAVLIGESLLKSPDIARKMRDIMGRELPSAGEN